MPSSCHEGKKRILVLLWHAPQQVITAGGFRRTYEILDRTIDSVEVCAVDDRPSFLRDLHNENVTLVEYPIPGLVRKLEDRFFWYERALEWIISTVMMISTSITLRIKGDRFDAIFVPSSEQIPALLAGIVAKYVFKAPLVACNLNIDIFPGPLRKPLARLHNFADKVIAISDHLMEELNTYGVRTPIVKNGVGLDTSLFLAVEDPAGKQYEAVFVGRHDVEKGVFDVIEIWNLVTKRRPGARLVMIGSSNPINRAKLDRKIAEYGLEETVVRVGTVDDESKVSLMKSSRVLLFPSYVEEWGIVPQEALACGLPVIAYDLPVYKENIKCCEAVFLERIGDLDGMVSRTSELLEGDRSLEYEKVGPEFVKRFRWDEIAVREFEIILD